MEAIYIHQLYTALWKCLILKACLKYLCEVLQISGLKES